MQQWPQTNGANDAHSPGCRPSPVHQKSAEALLQNNALLAQYPTAWETHAQYPTAWENNALLA
eukprot:1053444-Lingulodinium_polyedra.AAC.1